MQTSNSLNQKQEEEAYKFALNKDPQLAL